MIAVKNLTKNFQKNNCKTSVLKDVNVNINKGEIVAILGPSGAGKSVFLRCLNGLEKVTSGSVIFKGRNLTNQDCNIDKLRRHVGMVFQHFNLFSHLNVIQNITFAPIKTGIKNKEEAKKDAIDLLKKVGLEHKFSENVDSLSGGQKQRIAIVRALIMEPDVMLFDEPTSALDPEMTREVLSVVKKVAADGMTMVLVTHEIQFAKQIASRILFFDDGNIIEDSSPDEIFENPKHPRVKEFFSKVL
ncbi:MAG: amino acid ABC transporter ATP-binding protein [Oscillospiraceae bacterium]|nr:amino acid ABC transporter ATP-binding protein [Oscillospiraceae bacterium]